MVFKRYSSPFLFLNKLLDNSKFSSGVDSIFQQRNDEKLWELYLSLVPIMALNGTSKSFEDWKSEVTSNNTTEEVDLEEVKERSFNILKNFKPE